MKRLIAAVFGLGLATHLGCAAGNEGDALGADDQSQLVRNEDRIAGVWKTTSGYLVLRHVGPEYGPYARSEGPQFHYYAAAEDSLREELLVTGTYRVTEYRSYPNNFTGVLTLEPLWHLRDTTTPTYVVKRPISVPFAFSRNAEGRAQLDFDGTGLLPLGPRKEVSLTSETLVPEMTFFQFGEPMLALNEGMGAAWLVGNWTFPDHPDSAVSTRNVRQVNDHPLTVRPSGTAVYRWRSHVIDGFLTGRFNYLPWPGVFGPHECAVNVNGSWSVDPAPHSMLYRQTKAGVTTEKTIYPYRADIELKDPSYEETEGCDVDSSVTVPEWNLEFRSPNHVVFHPELSGRRPQPITHTDTHLINGRLGLVRVAPEPTPPANADQVTLYGTTATSEQANVRVDWFPSSTWLPEQPSEAAQSATLGTVGGGQYQATVRAPALYDDVYVGVVSAEIPSTSAARWTETLIVHNPGVASSIPRGLACYRLDPTRPPEHPEYVSFERLPTCEANFINE